MAEVRRLRPTDLDTCDALVAESNWNQVRADWEDLLARADCFAMEVDGEVAGTSTSLVHPCGVAWIGMVLVAKAHRGKGYGRELFATAVEAASSRAEFVGLDATELGAPLYNKFDFRTGGQVSRWQRDPAPFATNVSANGSFGKPGRQAWHFTGESTAQLEGFIAAHFTKAIIWDRIEPAESELGFQRTRLLQRMYRGGHAPPAGVFEAFALRGFEYGI